MSALSPAERQQHAETSRALFASVLAVEELPDGYAFHLAGDRDVLARAAAFVAFERLCCPFFGFAVEVEPYGGPLRLRLTGGEGIKPFIRAELGGLLGERPGFPSAE